jgi:hypothetical protein
LRPKCCLQGGAHLQVDKFEGCGIDLLATQETDAALVSCHLLTIFQGISVTWVESPRGSVAEADREVRDLIGARGEYILYVRSHVSRSSLSARKPIVFSTFGRSPRDARIRLSTNLLSREARRSILPSKNGAGLDLDLLVGGDQARLA